MRGYFSLEIDLPTLEVFGVKELIEMQVRAPISRIFHRTILRMNNFLQCDKEDSRFHDSWQIEELVLYNPAVLLNSFTCSAIVPVRLT